MPQHILIIDGHPDPSRGRFVHALAAAYREAALAAGHDVQSIAIAKLGFPWLRSSEEFQKRRPPAAIEAAQRRIAWADHVAIFYPLWLGLTPSLTKAFFEQCLRPGFAFGPATGRGLPKQELKGRSARVIVTMGMPTFFYRWFFRAHSLKSFERNVLHFCGIRPVRATIVGMVESKAARERAQDDEGTRNRSALRGPTPGTGTGDWHLRQVNIAICRLHHAGGDCPLRVT